MELDEITKEAAIESIDLELEHPRAFYQQEDVERARANIRETEWGGAISKEVIALARLFPNDLVSWESPPDWQPILDTEDAILRELRPQSTDRGYWNYNHGAAYGRFSWGASNVSPVTGGPLRLRSWQSPGELIDDAGNVFPGTIDGVDIPFSFDGWVIPTDVPASWAAADHVGETLYLRSAYNGIVSRVLGEAVEPMAHAYVASGDDRYAEKAAVILDILGSVAPGTVADTQSWNQAWLHRRGYTAGRDLCEFVRAATLIWDTDAFAQPSAFAHNTSIKEHIAETVLVDGADHLSHSIRSADRHSNIRKSHSFPPVSTADYSVLLNNGTMDYNKGMFAVSLLLGLDVGWDTWNLDGRVSFQNFITNTVFRDGQYYETSRDYGDYGFTEWATLVHNHACDLQPFTEGNRFATLNIDGVPAVHIAGRIPPYGDLVGGPDVEYRAEQVHGNFGRALHFWAYANDGAFRDSLTTLLARIADGDPNDHLLNWLGEIEYYRLDHAMWPLYRLDGSIPYTETETDVPPRSSELLPGQGLAYLRPKAGHNRGVMLRYGPTLNHGNDDTLNLNIFGAGRELSYDPGDREGQLRRSWHGQTIAHNGVVVDETPSGNAHTAGASVLAFAQQSGCSYVDVDTPDVYDHLAPGEEGYLDTYRRSVAMIDSSESESYVIDIFRVSGGEQHDFSFHGGGVHFSTNLDLSSERPGSLASTDYNWGDQLNENYEIEGYETEGQFFNPEPGNGYGMLGNPQVGSGAGVWEATWRLDDRRGEPGAIQLTMLPDSEREIFVCDGPNSMQGQLGYSPAEWDDYDVKYTIARNKDTSNNQFVSVIDPVRETFQVSDVTELPVHTADSPNWEPIALRATLRGGVCNDYIVSSLGVNPILVQCTDPVIASIETDAEFAQIRVDEEGVQDVNLIKGSRCEIVLQGEDEPITIHARNGSVRTGVVKEVADEDDGLFITIAPEISDESGLVGEYVFIDHPSYTRNSPFKIERIVSSTGGSRLELSPGTNQIQRGEITNVTSSGMLETPVEIPFTRGQPVNQPGRPPNGYMDGRQLTIEGEDIVTIVEAVVGDNWNQIKVTDADHIQAGDVYRLTEIKPGDQWSIPVSIELQRRDDGTYQVQGGDGIDVSGVNGSPS